VIWVDLTDRVGIAWFRFDGWMNFWWLIEVSVMEWISSASKPILSIFRLISQTDISFPSLSSIQLNQCKYINQITSTCQSVLLIYLSKPKLLKSVNQPANDVNTYVNSPFLFLVTFCAVFNDEPVYFVLTCTLSNQSNHTHEISTKESAAAKYFLLWNNIWNHEAFSRDSCFEVLISIITK
jgi:hypothetical protein